MDYPAGIITNLLPENADPRGISKLQSLLQEANSRCPTSTVVVSGYSQGAAIVHGAMAGVSDSIKNQIAAAVLFGDTRNQQEGGMIAGFPQDKTLIICNSGDLVCVGTLVIAPAHLQYEARVPEAVDFIASKV